MTTQEVFSEMKNRLSSKPAAELANFQGVYQFTLTGDDAAQYHVTVSQDGAEIVPGAAPDPGVTITMNAEDFKSLVQGQLNPMTAFMSGKLTVAGDMSLALKLQSLIG